MQSNPAAYELLHKIAYSLSYGQIPSITLPSRNKQYNRYSLLQNDAFPIYCEDLFSRGHLRQEYKDYLLQNLNPALRSANRSDFSLNSALVQGEAEYFVLNCPDGSSKLLYMGPYTHVIGLVPSKADLQKKAQPMTSVTPSNISATELAKIRQKQRPFGEMRY